MEERRKRAGEGRQKKKIKFTGFLDLNIYFHRNIKIILICFW